MIGTVTSSAVLAWSSVVARTGVPAWDAALFRRVNDLPDAMAPVVWVPMQAGALAAPVAAAVIAGVRGDRQTAARLASTGVAAWGAAKLLKRFVGRGRPGDHDDRTVLRVGSADHGLGYPSGHAAVAMTIARAAPFGSIMPRGTGYALAAIVGGSRIYVGAHYPLDVIGGWALGRLVAGAYETIEGVILRRSGEGR